MLAKVGDFLSAEQVHELRGKSNLVGALLVLHAWALIFGSMALFVWWPNPFSFLLAVMVIGTRQLGLAILMHDAAHRLLFTDRRVNDWVGDWLCVYPIFASLAVYRPYHLKHHRFTQQAEDPDLGVALSYPVSRGSLRRKIIRDLIGRTAYQSRAEQIRYEMGPASLPLPARLANLARRERGAVLVNLVLFGLLAAIGYWWLYPALWLLPLATWYQLVSRIRKMAEHAVVPDNDDPLRNTRTTHANPLMRLLLAPYWVNYHLEHHLFVFVPCWRLPAAHRALLAAAQGAKMEFQPGYRDVLRAATTLAGNAPRSAGRRPGAQYS